MTSDPLEEIAEVQAVRHPLWIPAFRRLWLSMGFSLIGDNFYLLAVQTLTFRLTGSPGIMAAVLLFAAVPRAILIVFGGALTDRVSSRVILFVATAVRAAVLACVGFLAIDSSLKLWHLYAMALAFGICDAIALPAGSRWLPSLVRADDLLRASGFMQATVGIFTLVGLAPIGATIAAVGPDIGLLIGALSLLLAAGAISQIATSASDTHQASPPLISAVREGIDYIFSAAGMLAIIVTGIIFNLFLEGPLAVGLPYLGSARFHSPTSIALMLSCVAGGGILGAIGASSFAALSLRRVVVAALVLCGIALGLVGAFTSIYLNCISLIFAGAAAETANLHMISRLQKQVDPAFRGRVMSLVILGSAGINPLSVALAGVFVVWLQGMSFLAAGIAIVLVGLIAAICLRTREAYDCAHSS